MAETDAISDNELAEAKMAKSSKFGWIWLAPIIAAAIALWLAYKTIAERGPLITIYFEEAAGLEAGKTPVKFKDVEIGRVETVRISDDLETIVVTARMVQGTEGFLNENTQFWVVRPRIGTGGVSGLDTLVSGAYVEFDPGDGETAREFVGLEEPPLVLSSVPGTRYQLRARSLAGLTRGSPIYHRGLEVGSVLGYELLPGNDDLIIHVFVQDPHDDLISNNTRFYNASGLNISAGTEGFGLEVESVQALMTGGIAFINSGVDPEIEIAAENQSFQLYPNAYEAGDAIYDDRLPFLVEFTGSIRGLREGASVEVNGIKIGEVTSIDLVYDFEQNEISTPVIIEIEPQRFTVVNGELSDMNPYSGADELISEGLRAQLTTGSLITGELVVSLVFTDDTSLDGVDRSTDPPTLPTVPSDLDVLAASATGIMQKIAALPLEDIVADIRSTIASAQGLIESPEVAQSVASLNKAFTDLEGMISEVRGEAGPLVNSLRNTANQADRAIRQATALISTAEGTIGPESQMSYDMQQMMRELTQAARSIRVFADYLERHPDALIRGKQGGFQ